MAETSRHKFGTKKVLDFVLVIANQSMVALLNELGDSLLYRLRPKLLLKLSYLPLHFDNFPFNIFIVLHISDSINLFVAPQIYDFFEGIFIQI